jgi:HD-GYP domain-containing protein (c-di-GMP phosphodiesterase class II)
LGTDGDQNRIPRTGDTQQTSEGFRRVVAYVTSLSAVACVLAAVLVVVGERPDRPWVVVLLALSAAIAERWSVRLTTTTELSIYLLPTVFAAVVLGPLGAGIVAAASMLGDPELFGARPGRLPLLKWATYTSAGFITGAAAGMAATVAQDLVTAPIGSVIVATFLAMGVAELLDMSFSILTGLVRGRSASAVARSLAPVAVTSVLVYAPIVVVIALAYVEISPWTLPLFLVPALALQRLYGLYQRERKLTESLVNANETLARANLSFAEGLVATLDARDRYTAGHSAAVAIYSRDIAARMGLPKSVQDRVYLCGLVHDIGKIGLPAGLLEKPGALTLEERNVMKEHSAIGERILRNVDGYADIALVVRHHHERVDGEGYPDRLRADEIPLLSRIIAVADAYNAMTSDRPYRDAMPSRVARMRLAQAVESQFDTAAAAAFEQVLAGATEDYRMARRIDFRSFAQSGEPGAASPDTGLPTVVAGAA